MSAGNIQIARTKQGRPSAYTPEHVAEICEWLASGRSLRKWCEQPGKPSRSAVFRWLDDSQNAEFRDRYARARRFQAAAYADEVVDIADDCDPREAHKAKLQVDARRWAAGKLDAPKWGDRTAVDVGGQGGNPISWVELAKRASADPQPSGDHTA